MLVLKYALLQKYNIKLFILMRTNINTKTSNFDLDINNYSINDIERFLKLNEKVKNINKNNNKISCPDKPKSVNECTLALPKMPLRVKKVAYNTIKKENMVSIKVSTGYLLVDLLINNMWVAVISNSQGIREAFSTGSQAQ